MNAIFIYRLFQILFFPFIVVYFLVRGLKDRRYFQRFGERLGLLPGSFRQTEEGAIWLHAVSVGEVLSAVELLRRLRDRGSGRAPVRFRHDSGGQGGGARISCAGSPTASSTRRSTTATWCGACSGPCALAPWW